MENKQKIKKIIVGNIKKELVSKYISSSHDLEVVFTVAAQKHAAVRHPNDYAICLAHLTSAVESPTYVGQSPHHTDAIQLIYTANDENSVNVLVAVLLKQNNEGAFIVTSTYLVNDDKIDRQLRKGYLFKT